MLVFSELVESSFMMLDIDLDDANGQAKIQMILAMHEDIIHFFLKFMDSNHIGRCPLQIKK